MSLPAPYYERNGITIYCGDCREILPELPQVDLVLADPPYGIDYQSSWRTDWQRKAKIVGDNAFPVWIFEVLRPNNALKVFCRWDILEVLPRPKSFIVWDKCRHSMGNLKHEYGRQWEACAFYPFNGHAFSQRPKDIIRVPCIPPNDLVHPNEKPVALMTQLLRDNVGEVVLDPFMGSGSVLLAAKKLGRKCIGIEIEEKYCEIAAKRLSQEVMNLSEITHSP